MPNATGQAQIIITIGIKRNQLLPWLVWLSGLSAGLRTKGTLVQFQVRVHAWVAGQVPSRRNAKGNHTMMFLSLSFSLPSPSLKINKQNLKREESASKVTSKVTEKDYR